MKKPNAVVLAAALALLSACAQTGGGTGTPQQAASQRFECDNGLTAHIQNIGTDKIKIRVQDREGILTLAPSGSGERYVSQTGLWGSGGEWHQKGGEAYFAYTGIHGAKGASTCRLAH
ncbi:MliC family protein [Neisseria sp.]|uniref:MliC family protein n=1 Tax=Neisseria sp. TaxID=192066 RepID=UPI0026DD8899|nr:MliC family protein [Neisseria sp.]MDO4907782.1 MliC family protein [Neisseria sp.]